MARYRYSSFKRRKTRIRRRIFYAVSILVVVVLYLSVRSCAKGRSEETAAVDNTAKNQIGGVSGESASPHPSQLQSQPKPIPPSARQSNIPLSSDTAELIAEAKLDLTSGRIIAARDKLNEVLARPLNPHQRNDIKKQLAAMAEKWLFSRDVYALDKLCSRYKVRPGELLTNIAKRYKVPYEILMQINNISRPEALQAGETIKVINGPFHAIVYCSAFTMDLYLQNTFVRSFPIGLGEAGRETPTGLWRVKAGEKLIKPIWTDQTTGRTYHPDDPDYPLGSRWIKLEGIEGNARGRTGFAIHGTKDANTIGTRSSRGCIRLHNGDVILIYNLLVPVYSQVRVVD